jgi:hypothetical protein
VNELSATGVVRLRKGSRDADYLAVEPGKKW